MTAKKGKAKGVSILTRFLGGHFEPTHSKNLNWALDQAIKRQRKIDLALLELAILDDDPEMSVHEAAVCVREILTGVVDSPA